MAYVSHEGEWHFRQPDEPKGSGRSASDEEVLGGESDFVVANEFALVRCRKVYTRNGERLEIHAPKRRQWVRLDAVQLEALTAQPPEALSDLVVNAMGSGPEAPEADVSHDDGSMSEREDA